MIHLMGNTPHDFVMSHNKAQLERLESFVHRTFNGQDFISFIKGLQHIYKNHKGLESVFSENIHSDNFNLQYNIHHFKTIFLKLNIKIDLKNISQTL